MLRWMWMTRTMTPVHMRGVLHESRRHAEIPCSFLRSEAPVIVMKSSLPILQEAAVREPIAMMEPKHGNGRHRTSARF